VIKTGGLRRDFSSVVTIRPKAFYNNHTQITACLGESGLGIVTMGFWEKVTKNTFLAKGTFG
jgi:hypothetical protein